MEFSENFLHFIWKFRLLNTTELFCTNGEALQVLHPGIVNKNAGPDFEEAKIVIGKTTWAGQVEIHMQSSEWMLHGHHHNIAYDSVILHVVYKHDKPVYRTNGTLIPTLVLENRFSPHLLTNYKTLMASVNSFPCKQHIATVDPVIVESFLTRLMVERMEEKSREMLDQLKQHKGNWEQTFYCFLARNFGFKVNALPFGLLAEALPLYMLYKHKDKPMQIAALIFGQAGFLEQDFFEDYPKELKREYLFLRKKYRLQAIDKSLWKFLRMRPQNFPTVRLAQFAALIAKTTPLFSSVLEGKQLKDIYDLFEDLPVGPFWENHYHFNKPAAKVILQPGLASVHNIVINTVCLSLFSYGKYTGQQEYADRALDFLEKMPPESNAVIRFYRNAGLRITNAFLSQALLQLNKCYCNQKKCLNCGIGIKILKK